MYGSEGFTKEEILRMIKEKERQIVYLGCEIDECREDLHYLQLELEHMEE